ncbi:hypothetical protein ACHAWF_002932, partial [Thalassiosira exigua]
MTMTMTKTMTAATTAEPAEELPPFPPSPPSPTSTSASSTSSSSVVADPSPAPLRICCYGSSSSRTPPPYLSAAYALGRRLALRGHTCVNGAGSSGCMAAMNAGASDGNGTIVGVIHEKFVYEGSDWYEGCHEVFGGKEGGGRREIVVARGNDLQERKRLLVEGADALVVLPGGPGTWDELWEMACARHVGFHSLPIVCVNVDGYYDPFVAMLERAHDDELLYKHPKDILHFERTPEEAVRWIEDHLAARTEKVERGAIARRTSMLKRMQSNVSGASLAAWRRFESFFGDDENDGAFDRKGDDANDDREASRPAEPSLARGTERGIRRDAALFAAGTALGLLVASGTRSTRGR